MAVIKKKSVSSAEDICELAVQMGISNATAAVLLNRGIYSEEEGRQFLDCDDSVINDPFLMLGMYEAVDFLNDAIENGRRITLYGDYDVDGITSLAILYKYLCSLGAFVNCYIPDRFTEGYGLNMQAVSKIASKGTEILISVDCGITSVNEVKLAKELGLDVMIVDHHTVPEELPDADVILNPKQPFCEYPFKELCSAGLAIKIVEALGGRQAAREYYDIAAIGIVADVVSLKNENRYYVKHGLVKINTDPSPGVKSLKLAAGYGDKSISARGVAFGMAPRLNAAGRLASAKEGLSLFLSDEFRAANELAVKLNEYNEERRSIEKEIYDSSIAQITASNVCDKRILIVTGNGWNKGVIGIVASKLVEKYNRPAIVISCDEDVCTASARSIEGFNIYDALNSCRELYTKFGGHSQAAGFSVSMQNIPEFTQRIEQYANKSITDEMLIPFVECEFRLSPTDIDMKMAKELARLEPFGKDNEPALFYSDRLDFTNATVIGKDKNVLRAAIGACGINIDCVGFGMSDYIDTVNCAASKTAVFSVDVNVWQGIEKVQLSLKELKLGVYTEDDILSVSEAMSMRTFEAFENGFLQEKKNFKANVDINVVADALKEKKMGILAVVTDKKSLGTLLQRMINDGVSDDVEIHIGAIPQGHEFGVNTVLVMPYNECALNGEFSQVFLPDNICPDKFKGMINVEYYISDDPLNNVKTLDRTDFARVYKVMHENKHKLTMWMDISQAAEQLSLSSGTQLGVFELKLILGVFEELGFISTERAGRMIKVMFSERIEKKQLSQSSLFEKYMLKKHNTDMTEGV